MNCQKHASGGQGGDADRAVGGIHRSPVAGAHAKTTQHQVREIHRLVDDALEDLEQVLRALRYLEKDV